MLQDVVKNTLWEYKAQHGSDGYGQTFNENPFNPGRNYLEGWDTVVYEGQSTVDSVGYLSGAGLDEGDSLGSNYGPQWKSIFHDDFDYFYPGVDEDSLGI